MRLNYFNKPITKRFIDAFPQFEAEAGDYTHYFWETWVDCPFYTDKLTKDDLKDIYYHLLAKFYDWHFIYKDDLGIMLNVMHTIEEYYPNVKEKINIVAQIRDMDLDEFSKSGISISSQAQNPKVEHAMDELVDLVDNQDASFQLKSKEQSLKAKFYSLYDGIMDEFTERFRPCFVKLYTGLTDYIYVNNNEEEEEDE